jgi:hypothetical protein
MGPELGLLYHELEEEVDWLQQKWNEFRELFGKGPERIELLNNAASNFFFLLHKLMFEDAMLHLCRLTDPAETRVRLGKRVVTRKNLTVMALAHAISDPGLKGRVEVQARQVKKNCEFARGLRNIRLAHADLESFRNGIASPKILSKHVEDALKSMRDLLGGISQHYGYPPSVLVKDPFGARSLVYYLENAARAVKH